MIGLVDPIRTSKAFWGELTRREIDFVTIESGLVGTIPDVPGRVVRGHGIQDQIVGQLRHLGVTRLLGCVDPSITYTDSLSAQLGLPFNGLRLSEARRNKALMSAAVRKAGLRVPLQHETDRLEDLLVWLQTVDYPVVVKPVCSGGTDNVHACGTAEEVAAAFSKIYGTRNLMGAMNTSVLAQEFIDGIEYVIDCVSYDGRHVPIDFFEYQKGMHNGRSFVYEKERYLHSDDPRVGRLQEFAMGVLDALEFRHGPSHMEVKVNSRGEVVLIEVGARLNGGDIYKLVQDTRCDGKSQVEYTIDEVVGQEPPMAAYRSRSHGVRVYVVSTVEGRLTQIRHLDRIAALPSYRRTSLHVELGKVVQKTTDMSNDTGWIDLTNAEPLALRRDEQKLDEILSGGILVVEA